MSNSWVIEAIEAAAIKKATDDMQRRLIEGGITAVLGLTLPQLIWLMADWEIKHGAAASTIDPESPHVG